VEYKRNEPHRIAVRSNSVEPSMTEFRIVRVSQAARLLGVNRSTLWRWIRAGIIPAPAKLGPSARGWKIETLQRWLTEKGAQ
jgi:prophage regulatory protein